jgi:hypothetical protein
MVESNTLSDFLNRNRHLLIVISLLVVFAVVATSIRILLSSTGSFTTGDSAWSATLIADIVAADKGTMLEISPPWNTRHARLYGQSQYHPGLRQRRTRDDKQNRNIILATIRGGELNLQIRFDFHISQQPRSLPSRPALTDSERINWLNASSGIEPEHPLSQSLIDKYTQDAPDTELLVRRLFDHISEHIRLHSAGSNDAISVLQGRLANALGMTRALVMLLRGAHLPSRIVTGLDLSLAADRQPRYWLETWFDNKWHFMDVVGGAYQDLPASYIPLRKGSESLLQTDNGQIKSLVWNIRQVAPPKGLLGSDTPRFYAFLDLNRLDPATRKIMALLLLLPLGALSTEFLRHLVGIRTFGTFTPTLLALAAVFVDWGTALTVFFLVTIIGIGGRSLLPDILLTRISRLAVVFTLVAIIMALVVSFLVELDPSVDSAVVLLPTVILTMLIDRFYSVADESGLRTALIRLGWTLAAASLAMILLLQDALGTWLVSYPEMHALTIALIILLGQYRGKRLSSLPRLDWLLEPSQPINRSRKKKSPETG